MAGSGDAPGRVSGSTSPLLEPVLVESISFVLGKLKDGVPPVDSESNDPREIKVDPVAFYSEPPRLDSPAPAPLALPDIEETQKSHELPQPYSSLVHISFPFLPAGLYCETFGIANGELRQSRCYQPKEDAIFDNCGGTPLTGLSNFFHSLLPRIKLAHPTTTRSRYDLLLLGGLARSLPAGPLDHDRPTQPTSLLTDADRQHHSL